MEPIKGTRRDFTDELLEPGEYGKCSVDGEWYGIPPGNPHLLAGLRNHTVEEHEDGTISVTPSILVRLQHRGLEWHGYIEHGYWRQV